MGERDCGNLLAPFRCIPWDNSRHTSRGYIFFWKIFAMAMLLFLHSQSLLRRVSLSKLGFPQSFADNSSIVLRMTRMILSGTRELWGKSVDNCESDSLHFACSLALPDQLHRWEKVASVACQRQLGSAWNRETAREEGPSSFSNFLH